LMQSSAEIPLLAKREVTTGVSFASPLHFQFLRGMMAMFVKNCPRRGGC
jgi:hypothetical protein